MCGISGYVGAGSINDLESMTACLRHRGPDDVAFWQGPDENAPVGFGFRRLIVLDPPGGRQPMLSKDCDLVVVHNGEIYNHHELRAELAAAGHRFESDHSDTEVLIHGYRQWGEGIVNRLRGMYAFAIWDARRQRLFAATDPFGKKPFYYGTHGEGLVFASELLACASHHALPLDLDRTSLMRFFAYGFIPAPHSPLRAVAKLPAGHTLTFEASSGKVETKRYWQFRITAETTDLDWEESKSRLRDLLEQAVARRLEADVPLGCMLSGGLDSAIVAALARRLRPDQRIPCFTIGFREASYDETDAAKATAAFLGSDHHHEVLSIDRMEGLLDQVLRRMDEPLADPSLLPTSLLCEFARKHVTVALSGDGADELFAGYDTFAALPWAELYNKSVPPLVHNGVSRLAKLLPRRDNNLSFDFKLRRMLRGLSHEQALWHAVWLAPADLDEISELFGETQRPEDLYDQVLDHWQSSPAQNPRNRALEYYVDFYLQSDILAKVDRSSMMASLEVRSPFLDKDLADFCATLPFSAKYAGGVRKRLLRDVAQDLLPREVLERPKKGFGIPISAWLRRMRCPEPTAALDMGLDPAVLRRAWSQHQSGRRDHRGLLWAWFCLDRWHASLRELNTRRQKAA